jgi:hypothetical protein
MPDTEDEPIGQLSLATLALWLYVYSGGRAVPEA